MITRELCLVIFTYRVHRGSDHDLDANKELIRLNCSDKGSTNLIQHCIHIRIYGNTDVLQIIMDDVKSILESDVAIKTRG